MGDCCGSSGKAKQYNWCTDCECRDCTAEVAGDECVESAVGYCGSSSYVGDGFCDDNNNNAGCGWDGGDCCGSTGKNNQYNWCTDCSCRDCTYEAEGDGCVDNAIGTCQTVNFVGDGYCDDGNNNAGCDWDGGDCCGTSDKAKQYNYCNDCSCLDCTAVVEGDDCVEEAVGSCQYSSYVGDGYCDDGNNNAGCGWDDGDCCGSSGKAKQYNYCNDCSCLDCTAVVEGDDCVEEAVGSCQYSSYVGDGYCDDGNNNAGCGWDDGDCCGS